MSYPIGKAAELIERVIDGMAEQQHPHAERSYGSGMIEMAYACGLIGDGHYRQACARLDEAADKRWKELMGRKAA